MAHHAEYVVIKRGGTWWVTMDGQRAGPHDSEADAVRSAVMAAKTYERGGNSARVSVDDPDDGIPVIYVTNRD